MLKVKCNANMNMVVSATGKGITYSFEHKRGEYTNTIPVEDACNLIHVYDYAYRHGVNFNSVYDEILSLIESKEVL